MKRKIFSVLTSLILCVWMIPISLMATAEDATSPFKGSGTQEDPYQISTAYELRLLSELIASEDTTSAETYANASYIQTADIDLENEPFTPIGKLPGIGFYGAYNGNYMKILNLNIEEERKYVGLFGWVKGATITNLSVYGNVNVTYQDENFAAATGGLVGELCDNGIIKNCSFSGNVSSYGHSGGLCGAVSRSGTISSCYFNGEFIGNGNANGALVGIVNDQGIESTLIVENCYAVGEISDRYNETESSNCSGVIGLATHSNEASVISISNNYYLNTMADTGINGDLTTGCTKLASTALKACADMLGSPFVDNNETDGFNDGYPIFEWQSTPYQFKGSGTVKDPYQISNKEELKKMRDLINSTYFNADYGYAHYIQTSDIDLENELWIPIGTYYVNGANNGNAAFGGHYNGGRYEIANLYVNESTNYSGLFGRAGRASISDGAVIENVSVINGNVSSTANYVGGICGEVAYNSRIRNCSFNGSVSGKNYVGGIVGKFYRNGNVSGCYHNGDINAETYGGGVVGVILEDSYNVTVENCYHAGNVQSTDSNAGGIVGKSTMYAESAVVVSNSYYLKNGDLAGANGTFTTCEVTALTSNLLKNVAADLGSPFVKNTDSTMNDGYPVFAWQLDTWGKGDINLDGEVNVADAVYLQGYLLCRFSFNETEWHAADLIDDGSVDAFDMVIMRRILICG